MSAIATPTFTGLTVTRDPWGEGVNDAGTPYATFDIARPDTDRRIGTRLASLTLYADGWALVDDRLNGSTVADMRAAGKLRDMLAERYPHAIHSGYRYV